MDNNNSLYPQLRCSIIGGDSTVQMGTSAFAGRPASGDAAAGLPVTIFSSFLFFFSSLFTYIVHFYVYILILHG